MSGYHPALRRAREILRDRRRQEKRRAFFDVVSGLSDHDLAELDHVLSNYSDAQRELPEVVQFVLRRVKCIEDADRIVANLCTKGGPAARLAAA